MAKAKTSVHKKSRNISDMLILTSCLFSQDSLVGQDQSFSIWKIVDRVNAPSVPIGVTKLFFTVEFTKAESVTPEELSQAIEGCNLVLVPPSGKEETLGEINMSFKDEDWEVHRLILDLSGFVFPETGGYDFQVVVKPKGQKESVVIAQRTLRCRLVKQPSAKQPSKRKS
jgi:hypothetical protein